MAQSRTFDNKLRKEGCWIRYCLDLRGIKLEDVAKKAHRSISLVSKVIKGERRSEKVETVLAEMLGYISYKQLWADAFISAERRAV